MTYRILADDRKTVKTKLEELTGRKASYSGAPAFTYTLDGFSIGRTGTVETTDEADEEVIRGLIEAGLIEGAEDPQEASESDPEDGAEEVTADEDGTQETAESAEGSSEDAGTEESEENGTDEEGIRPAYSFPLSQHTASSVCNLVYTIYSKGDLLNASTGGDFFVSEALKEKLKAGSFSKPDDVVWILSQSESGDLRGLEFTDGKVTFTGFPETDDPAVVRAWGKLAEAVNKAAIQQKRVNPKRNEETNEKFAFRTWLTRIGMNGPELKAERAIYYRNLKGHTAFRTPADAEHWKELQKVRAEKKKAAEAGASEAENTQEQDQAAEA